MTQFGIDKSKKIDPSITYFPVGNGDTTLIQLADATTILIDLNVTKLSGDKNDPSRYDVRTHLLRELRRDSQDRPHLDAFVLSHPDEDHLRGAEDVFFLGDPSSYSSKHKKADLIIIDELWFAPRIFCEHHGDLCKDAQLIRDEAERRIALYRKGVSTKKEPGDRLRAIGYTDNPELSGLEQFTTIPGTVINQINGKTRTDFEFFVHAPFKWDTDNEDGERNDTSIVLQARFSVSDVERAALAMFGGDSGCAVWERISERSSDDETLAWDLFLAPHHCSWTFFSELSSEEQKPSKEVLALLDRRREGAKVIASSKPIKDDDDNPPHFIAAEGYRNKVGVNNFFCTGEHPDEKSPQPIYFSMTKNGPVKDTYAAISEVQSSAAKRAAIATPKTYG